MEERFFKFSLFLKYPELVHGISRRHYGDMRFGKIPDSEVVNNREHFFHDLGVSAQDVVVARLVHKTRIVAVSNQEKGRGVTDILKAIQETDGLMTFQKDIYLMVTVADCIPILIYDPVIGAVSVIHAGWRGIIGQIVKIAIEKFKNNGSEPSNIVAGVGPGICQKHFVVKTDVLDQFLKIYPKVTLVRNHNGYVDLKKAIAHDFKDQGVSSENIEISQDCPVCQNGKYGSVRKEGKGAPASAAIIGIKTI
ncbi:MAG: hypothetical protein HW405_696 [Candidatus Berkelbacteria bacterium]|nr:hypothetical protein [Candidatus Berkelbacteria bacterium]